MLQENDCSGLPELLPDQGHHMPDEAWALHPSQPLACLVLWIPGVQAALGMGAAVPCVSWGHLSSAVIADH